MLLACLLTSRKPNLTPIQQSLTCTDCRADFCLYLIKNFRWSLAYYCYCFITHTAEFLAGEALGSAIFNLNSKAAPKPDHSGPNTKMLHRHPCQNSLCWHRWRQGWRCRRISYREWPLSEFWTPLFLMVGWYKHTINRAKSSGCHINDNAGYIGLTYLHLWWFNSSHGQIGCEVFRRLMNILVSVVFN